MFIDNKYSRWYDSIVSKARMRSRPEDYCETHHIVPKSLGGSDVEDNLVVLTAREHYVCHLLLMKMVSTKRQKAQMVAAFTYMAHMKNRWTTKRYTSRLFAQHKAIAARVKSEAMSGEGNPRFGVKMSDDTKQRISASKTGRKVRFSEEELCKRREQRILANADPDLRKKVSDGLKKTYEITNPDGSIITITGMKDYCAENKLYRPYMLGLATGTVKYYKGYGVRCLGKLPPSGTSD